MKDLLGFYDQVVCRVWPEMSRKSGHERINTCALVADILEGHARFAVSSDLRGKIEEAAKEIREEERRP